MYLRDCHGINPDLGTLSRSSTVSAGRFDLMKEDVRRKREQILRAEREARRERLFATVRDRTDRLWVGTFRSLRALRARLTLVTAQR